MYDNRRPKIVYKLFINPDSNCRRTCASDIRTLLYRYGFGVVWISKELGDLDSFFVKMQSKIKRLCYTRLAK